MSREEREFLKGFEKAAQLTREIQLCPPRFTTPAQYVEQVARLHCASESFEHRGVAVGCLSAVGRDR